MANYIKGTYSKSIYSNQNGYTIGIFKISETNDDNMIDYVGRSITFTGYFHELNNIDTYIFYGRKVIHNKYGEQFLVDSYERCVPEGKDSIVEFLSSGLFKGIGEKKAKTIVDVLGDDSLNIILNNPNNLLLIPGITKNNVDTLYEKLREYESSYEIILFLTEKGFNTKDAMIIYNTYLGKTKDVINNNIYDLIDIAEMNFKKIDAIAIRDGISKDDKNRVLAAIIYIMKEISNQYGHCYYYEKELYSILIKVLSVNISDDYYRESLTSLINDSKVVLIDDKYYLKELYDAECMIVKRFRLLNSVVNKSSKKIDSSIKKLEEYFNIIYNEDQISAIKMSYLKQFLIITGGPGTGKTTIMKGIVELYRLMNNLDYDKLSSKVALLAPTGRAAKRMSEATLLGASTIHRFLKWNKETNKFQVNEYNKSDVSFVIIDEASMIDTNLMASLLKGLSANCKIVLVGDYNQLPSVGAGNVLYDLIMSNCFEVIKLNRLYRQRENSNIIELAYEILNDNIDDSIFNKTDDLSFIHCEDYEVVDNICDICKTYKDLSYKDFQILVPMYKGLAGIDEINSRVEEIFNNKSLKKGEIVISSVCLREGDKVIQLTNMPDDNVYNGDIGIIDNIKSLNKKEVYIDFDSNIVKYTPSSFNSFRLAYAISIHKAQGSEFDVVVIPIVKGFKKMLYRKLIYTAVTRCKKKLYLVGDISYLYYGVSNNLEDIRRTSIKDFLINGIK